MDPVMIMTNRYEYAGESWVTPLREFAPTDKDELLLWQTHYARLGIRTSVVPNAKKGMMLLVSEQDDQKVWLREYTWVTKRR